ncbi:heavy metal-associated isoprenylated plant protein 16-like [Carex rostrata]
MVKQRMVIKLSINEDKKKRTKALETAVGLEGVISVTLGDDNRLVLIGEGTDVIKLTTLLRKKLGYADVISVMSAEEYSKNWGNTTSTQRDYYSNYQYGVPSPYGYPPPHFYR